MQTAHDSEKREPSAPLPPGTTGLPLVGETLAFLKQPFAFVAERRKKHGPVFRTSILGRHAAIVSGPSAAALLLDEDRIERRDSSPPHIQALFGGASLPYLDGVAHRARKELVMSAFSHEALAAYLPAIDRIVAKALTSWAKRGEVSGISEMKRLAIAVILDNFVGVSDQGVVDRYVANYGELIAGFGALPVKLPGSALTRAMLAKDRLLSDLEGEVKRHRASALGTGLSRMLLASAENGTTMGDKEAVLETHHFFLAGYIVYCLFAQVAKKIAEDESIRTRLRQEVLDLSITPANLSRMPYLLSFTQEVKRTTPVLPFVFARAKRDFVFEGTTIPKGWMVLWALWEANTSEGAFREPSRFDPERFSEERGEHKKEHAFVPQGVGPALSHRCAGLDYATLLAQVFAVRLVQGYDVTLPEQDLAFRWSLPPEPRDGLRLSLRPRG